MNNNNDYSADQPENYDSTHANTRQSQTHTTRKNIISAVITILILFAGVMGYLKLSSQKTSTVTDGLAKKERRKVSFVTFSPQTTENNIALDGRLRAQERVNITSKVQGVMQESNRSVREGMYFEKGQILFTVDSREASYDLKASRSSLMTSVTQMMPDLKFDYPDSFEAWKKYLDDFDIDRPVGALPDPVSQQEKYFVSGRNIYNQFYNIKSQETRLSEYTIYAPFSGVVTAANIYPGALISPGTILATMINTNRYEIAAPIPLDDLKYIKIGQRVNLRSDELDKDWTGKVTRIGTQIDATTQNIPIYISVSGSDLKDGIYLKGSVNGSSLDAVTQLPKSIFVTPTSVYVIQDSTIVVKEINTVKRTNDHVLVDNLKSDEMVVTSSLAGLFEGQKVTY